MSTAVSLSTHPYVAVEMLTTSTKEKKIPRAEAPCIPFTKRGKKKYPSPDLGDEGGNSSTEIVAPHGRKHGNSSSHTRVSIASQQRLLLGSQISPTAGSLQQLGVFPAEAAAGIPDFSNRAYPRQGNSARAQTACPCPVHPVQAQAAHPRQ
eukprot:426088-Pelagomonas_calceolata.AAC.5